MSSADSATCLEIVRAKIHPSLYPLIFEYPEDLESDDFHWAGPLPHLASIFVQLAAIAISLPEVYGGGKPEGDEQKTFRETLQAYYAGHQEFTDLFALSLIQCVPDATPSRPRPYIGKLSDIVDWRNILVAKSISQVNLEAAIAGKNLYKMFVRLIESLLVLEEVEWFPEDGQMKVRGDVFLVFPFIVRSAPDSHFSHAFARSLRYMREEDGGVLVTEVPQGGSRQRISMSVDESAATVRRSDVDSLNEALVTLDIDEVPKNIVHFFDKGYPHLVLLAKAMAAANNCDRDGKRVVDAIRAAEIYKDTFKSLPDSFNLEEELLILFVEHGPEPVLKFAFSGIELGMADLCDFYITHFQKLGHRDRDHWIQVAREESDKQVQYLENSGMKGDVLANLRRRMRLEAEIWGLLAAAGPARNESINIGKSLVMREESFANVAKAFPDQGASEHDVVACGGSNLEASLRFLILLYRGLPAYAESLWQSPEEENPATHEQAMCEAAREHRDSRFDKLTLGGLVAEFRETIKTPAIKQSVLMLLGRDQVCCPKTFNRLTNCIPELRNKVLHWDPSLDKKERATLFIENTNKLFLFLRTGNTLPDHGRWYEDCVYPHVIGFREAHERRGGMLIRAYELQRLGLVEPDKGRGEKQPIKILTSLRYPASHDYYCIPRTDKSSDQYWIDPFIITCDRFDEIVDGQKTS